jgi:hypothetical protein
VIRVSGGRWFIVKRPAQGGNDWARHAGEGGGSAARA